MEKSLIAAVAFAGLSGAPLSAEPASYPSPTDATMAFISSLEEGGDAVFSVFGPENEDLISSGDPLEDRINRIAILEMYRAGYRLEPQDDGSVVVALGSDGWPFPVPIAQSADGWAFDAEAGYKEVLAREIGGNELEIIDLLDAYVDVQAQFRLTDHDGDGVMEFARQIISSEESRDGLFWPGQNSLVGARLARASTGGYNDGSMDHQPEPYMGYYFRILEGQTASAPGGELSYLVNDNMVAGHAMLAVPAAYGETGIHSFVVSENGTILEADLGEDTLDKVATMDLFDPGSDWAPVQE